VTNQVLRDEPRVLEIMMVFWMSLLVLAVIPTQRARPIIRRMRAASA
jgi:hypothetical protein